MNVLRTGDPQSTKAPGVEGDIIKKKKKNHRGSPVGNRCLTKRKQLRRIVWTGSTHRLVPITKCNISLIGCHGKPQGSQAFWDPEQLR